MTSESERTVCVSCNKEKLTYVCGGCLKRYCLHDLTRHRADLTQQLDQIQNDHDQLRQNLIDDKSNAIKHPSIERIDQWEKYSIEKIKEIAQQWRDKWMDYSNHSLGKIEKKLNDLAKQIEDIHRENEFSETDLNFLNLKLRELCELHRSTDVLVERKSTALINNIHLRLPIWKANEIDAVIDLKENLLSPYELLPFVLLSDDRSDTRWEQYAVTVAGGNNRGERLDQLDQPYSAFLDDQNQTIYIADYNNHRIVEWTLNGSEGHVMAGGKGQGDGIDQLNRPTDVVIDPHDNSLFVADRENRRVIRWSRQRTEHGQIVISDIDCARLFMTKDGSLYVSDCQKNEVRRWKKGDTQGTVVAGGNGRGTELNQFHFPRYLFIDDDHTLYVSDRSNHRIMKWLKDAKEGMTVAGGNGQGNQANQLSTPGGVIVDQFGHIYVADCDNDRVMRWSEGAKEGIIVAGGNGKGQEPDQLNGPTDLSFDDQENLYVVDFGNQRIQKFNIEQNEKEVQ